MVEGEKQRTLTVTPMEIIATEKIDAKCCLNSPLVRRPGVPPFSLQSCYVLNTCSLEKFPWTSNSFTPLTILVSPLTLCFSMAMLLLRHSIDPIREKYIKL